MLDRFVSAAVALSMASLIWLYVRSRDQEILDNVPVPVQVSLAPGQEDLYECEVTGPAQVPVSFTGPPARIRELRNLLQRGEVHVPVTLAVPADRLGESKFIDSIRIDANDVHPPRGVIPLIVEGRNRVSVLLHRLIERQLPVRLEHTAAERFSQIVLEPASVLVRGPQEVLEQVRAIPTQPCSPPVESENIPRGVWKVDSIPLVQEINGRRIRATPTTVAARLTFQPQQKTYELTDVAVQFLCPPNFALRAVFGDERVGKINVRLTGPAGEDVPAVVAFVDLTAGRKWEPGLYEEPIKLQLPKDFQLAQTSQRSIAFQLVPNENASKTMTLAPGP
jgi:hypothetical protein